jgi:hypothetical protein
MPNSNRHTPPPQADDEAGGWHVEKKIPLAIIALIVMQTVAGVWSMSRMVGQVEQLKTEIGEFRAERYTREDARRDKELWQTNVQLLLQQGQERDRRITVLENWIDRQRTKP